jgi:hypothetical protein
MVVYVGGKTKEKNYNNEENKGNDDKEEYGPLIVVVKVGMHCESCARKVQKYMKDMTNLHMHSVFFCL